jgi:tetratricopeptide (TPR) repeat protein
MENNTPAKYDPFEDDDFEDSQIKKAILNQGEKPDIRTFLNDEFSEPNINNLIKDCPEAIELMRKSMIMIREDNWKGLKSYMKTCVTPEEYHGDEKLSQESLNTISFVKNFYLGVANFKEKEYDEAMTCFMEADQIHSYEQIHYNLALCFMKKVKFEEAIIYLDGVIKKNPNFFFAYYNLIKIYLQKKNPSQAYVNYRRLFDVLFFNYS